MQLVVNRFFETPLIRDIWPADADLTNQAMVLADAHTGDVTGVSKHRWTAQVDLLAPSAACYAAGAFWVVVVASESTTLTLDDPRMPMIRMHAPHLGFRAPDGKWDDEHLAVELVGGDVAMFPGWLRHAVDVPARRVTLRTPPSA
jgi:hypothetical protein